MIKIFKFGGAALGNVERIRALCEIIQNEEYDRLVIVCSAFQNVTNELTALAKSYYQHKENTLEDFHKLKAKHHQVLDHLVPNRQDLQDDLNDLFMETEWFIEDQPEEDFSYSLDQILVTGEIISSRIVSHFLNQQSIDNNWVDIRDYIITDNKYNNANVLWTETEMRLKKLWDNHTSKILVTQGFIASSTENFSTTLGREGSDYTASILSSRLQADSVTFWKDVPGIMSSDPKLDMGATKLKKLSYEEAIEMTYYGAKVIHPKTIKPIIKQEIPFFVKSFLHPNELGTTISSEENLEYPPLTVIKKDQSVLIFKTKDYSHISSKDSSRIFDSLANNHVKANLIMTKAREIIICLDHNEAVINEIKETLNNHYNINIHMNLRLTTVRHYTANTLDELKMKSIKYQMQDGTTLQYLCSD